jgi:hypothetical protein
VSWAGFWSFVATLMAMFMFSIGLFGFFKKRLSGFERTASLVCAALGMWYLFTHSLILMAVFLGCSIVFVSWAAFTAKRLAGAGTMAKTYEQG